MGRKLLIAVIALVSFFFLGGCTVRRYTVVKDRVDQDLTCGNNGFISGEKPEAAANDRKLTRQTYVTEIELGFPAKTGKKKQQAVTAATGPQAIEAESETDEPSGEAEETAGTEKPVKTEKYKVLPGETLQKISQKFYGTTKHWQRIFQANAGVLKGPNKIYPGQIIDIPVEETAVPAHLK